jgi:hypothetical protein
MWPAGLRHYRECIPGAQAALLLYHRDMATEPWELPDDKLIAQCRFEAFVGSGPGGQKRHKTNAAVRYTHLATGIHAIASDSRSQRENKIHALRDLRHKLALELRRPVAEANEYRPPEWLTREYPQLRINPKNPRYPAAVAEVMDVLVATHYEVAAAAGMLALSNRGLLRFLHEDHALWEKVNRVRGEMGMKPLKW